MASSENGSEAPDEIATAVRSSTVDEGLPDAFAIVIVDGPDRGRRIRLENGMRLVLGQGATVDVVLRDREVSRRHLAFEMERGKVRLVDLGSTNGTSVEGVTINDAWLTVAKSVQIGSTILQLEASDREAAGAQAHLGATDHFGRLLGGSLAIRRLQPLFEGLARSDLPVLIEGETGTGKEVLAEALHEMGPRAAGPYVVFDCTAVPANLLESELFGHERGAFTGAAAARKGVLESAHGGTLLIDEIGDLDLALQPKLLRVIDRREVRRIGSARGTVVDVRIIVATRRNLDKEVELGRFRDDLLHRIAVARVELPPLRRRDGDVELLARHFFREFGGKPPGPSAELLRRWTSHAWPGNIRELRNAVARQVSLGELGVEPLESVQSEPTGDDFLEAVLGMKLSYPIARQRVAEEFERRYVERTLAEHHGNVSRAAAASGIARRYLQVLRARRAK